jgi:hypothetical protein
LDAQFRLSFDDARRFTESDAGILRFALE